MIARAIARARSTADQIRRQEEQDERQEEMAAIQRAALLANLQEQGIVPAESQENISVEMPGVGTIQDPSRKAGAMVNTGVVDEQRYSKIGKTGFVQDRTRTKEAQRIASERQRAQMISRRVSTLKALDPSLRDADDATLMGIAEDDDAFQNRVQFRVPQKQEAPVRGTPEYLRAFEEEERIRARHRPTPRGREPRAMPASAIEKLAGLDNLEQQGRELAQSLSAAIKAGANVTGRMGGVIPTPRWTKDLFRMGGEQGADVRIKIGNLFSTLAKERGGTALSDAEIDLLRSFIPNDDDPEHQAIRKANQFVREMQRLKQNKIAAYQKYGYGGVIDGALPADDRLPYEDY